MEQEGSYSIANTGKQHLFTNNTIIMKNPVLLWPVLVLATAISSCSPPLSMVATDKLSPVIEMNKGACFGRCPVFTLTIYSNGVASYNGERHTDKMGLYLKRLPKSELEALLAAFKKADLWQYPDVYRSQFPDLPAVNITYHEAERSKSILGKETRPEAVIELEGRLNTLANSEGWTLRNAPDYQLPPGVIANQLVVELREETDQNAWLRNYAKQDMKLLKKVWPANNKLIVSYSTKVIDPPSMLELVRQDTEVLSAEYNRR